MNISNETKVGALAAISITILILGYNFLRGNQIFSLQTTVYAIYENVEGLNSSDPVQLNGLQIGQVNSLSFSKKDPGFIVAEINIVSDVSIPNNSIARIMSSDLLGSKTIAIILGDSPEFIRDGDTLVSEIQASLKDEVAKQILPVKLKAENLLVQIDSVLTIIQYFLNEESKKSFHKSFSNLEMGIANFGKISSRLDTLVASQTKHISRILANAASITTNLQENNALIANVISNLALVTDSLAASKISSTINNAQSSLKELSYLLEKINSGEGSMGLLLNDDGLYNNLSASAKDLDDLLIDLKENPQRYVRISVVSFGGEKKKKKKKEREE